MSETRPCDYPGTVEQFAALLERLQAEHPAGWPAESGGWLKWHRTQHLFQSHMARWEAVESPISWAWRELLKRGPKWAEDFLTFAKQDQRLWQEIAPEEDEQTWLSRQRLELSPADFADLYVITNGQPYLDHLRNRVTAIAYEEPTLIGRIEAYGEYPKTVIRFVSTDSPADPAFEELTQMVIEQSKQPKEKKREKEEKKREKEERKREKDLKERAENFKEVRDILDYAAEHDLGEKGACSQLNVDYRHHRHLKKKCKGYKDEVMDLLQKDSLISPEETCARAGITLEDYTRPLKVERPGKQK